MARTVAQCQWGSAFFLDLKVNGPIPRMRKMKLFYVITLASTEIAWEFQRFDTGVDAFGRVCDRCRGKLSAWPGPTA
jgi:hypothetical protein